MSGQWEVVGKKKGKENPQPGKQKDVKDSKKQVVNNSIKVEEVLPMSQVKSLYSSAAKNNKENRKPQEKPKPQENGSKKTQKKPEKPQEPKIKPPKSIESALNLINIEDFKNVYEQSKKVFPDGPLIWLKELVQFLNQRVTVEIQDQTFFSRPNGYPFSVIPAPIKSVMEKAIKEAGKSNAQLFYDICLTAMATDMGKNSPALGHKFFLQYLAMNEPKLVINSLSKHVILRNSYQNRQPIGLSILWAVGQAGVKDLNVGLKVFQEMMLPVIEMKSYSRYVIKYLIDLINNHESVGMSKDQYLLVLDVVFANYKNFPTELKQDLHKIVPKLQHQLFNQSSNEKCYSLIDLFLKKLLSNNNNQYKNEICAVIMTCLEKDQTSYGAWNKCYTKYLLQSAIMLNYIDVNWKSVSKTINRKLFLDMLNTYSVTNEELMTKKRKEDGLLDSVAAIKKLKDKMAVKKRSGFPYKFMSFLLICTVGGILYYDISLHGSWKASRTSAALSRSGVYDYTNKALERTHWGLLWIHERIDEQIPGYYEWVSGVLEPYTQLVKDLFKVGCNIFLNIKNLVAEKYPGLVRSIDSFAPGLLEQSQQAVHSVWITSVSYVNRSVDYLKTEVFVGQLAPENVQKVVLEAFNTTQQKATEYYHWFYEKVQSTIK